MKVPTVKEITMLVVLIFGLFGMVSPKTYAMGFQEIAQVTLNYSYSHASLQLCKKAGYTTDMQDLIIKESSLEGFDKLPVSYQKYLMRIIDKGAVEGFKIKPHQKGCNTAFLYMISNAEDFQMWADIIILRESAKNY